jgi:ATP-binding cassette, subfamily C, bacterial
MSAPAPRATTGTEPTERPSAVLRRMAADVWRMQPRRVAAAVALSLAVSALEAAGVLVLVQLLAAAGIGGAGEAGGLGGAVARAFAAAGVEPTLAAVLALYVAVTAAQAVAQRAQMMASWRVEAQAALEMRRRLYRAIAGARWLHFTRVRSSDLVQALTTECDRVGFATSYLLSIVVSSLVALVYLALALRVSATVSLVALLCGGALMLALRRQNRHAHAAGEGLTRAGGEVMAAATEHLQSMKVVKSYGAEERNVALFSAVAEQTLATQLRAARAYGDSRLFFSIGSVGVLAVLTWLALEALGLPGALALVLIFLFSRLVPRLQSLQNLYQMALRDLPAYAHVERRVAALEAEREALSGAAGVHALADGVRFEGVSFTYPEAARDAVDAVTLEIGARRTTAVVGPSGSGKTTLADLVMGLVAPREGQVVVDGRVLEEGWMRGWREGIGYVAQETVLFHDSVGANLRWARPEATDDELWDALRAAAADAFVSALPRGLETVIGDRGVRLSGGERQRLALARALLRRPALLILDEATSALDTENERRIRAAVRELHGKTTILLITHRLSSVRDADVIHVMEEGRLVESGTWAELMARPGGRFRALWRSQEAEGEAAEEPSAAPS